MTGTDAIERTLVAIREQGGRVTDQRRAILRALFERSDHVTADDLVGMAAERLPDVHITTVYRFLDTLEAMGLVTHVHLDHGAAVYHLSEHRHAHVVCDTCGAVGQVEHRMLADWSRRLDRAIGFALVDQHFALAGRCAACRSA